MPSPTGVSSGGWVGGGTRLGDEGASGKEDAVAAVGVGEMPPAEGADGPRCSISGMGEAGSVGAEVSTLRSTIAGAPPPAWLPMNAPAPTAASNAPSRITAVIFFDMNLQRCPTSAFGSGRQSIIDRDCFHPFARSSHRITARAGPAAG